MGKNLPITKPAFDDAELKNVRECLESGWVTQGPRAIEFEKLIAERQDVQGAVVVSSCTTGLHLAMLALGIQPSDEVIVPAFTWVTSANAALYVGATPVFVDIDPLTFNIDPHRLESVRTDKTKAIIAVHLFGRAAPMRAINAFAKTYDLKVLEDAACAIGTQYDGQLVGGLGDLAAFSFHPRKVITTGEGGAVTGNDLSLLKQVRGLRSHGNTGPSPDDPEGRFPFSMGVFDVLGFNMRLSDIQAAIGIAQMAKLDGLLAERRARAETYIEELANCEVGLPNNGDAIEVCGHTYQSFVIRITKGGRDRRNEIMLALQAEGIQTRPGTHAVHDLDYYRNRFGFTHADYPNAWAAEHTTITLPIFPGMTDTDQDRIITIIKKYA